jgi:hypothetical protein
MVCVNIVVAAQKSKKTFCEWIQLGGIYLFLFEPAFRVKTQPGQMNRIFAVCRNAACVPDFTARGCSRLAAQYETAFRENSFAPWWVK